MISHGEAVQVAVSSDLLLQYIQQLMKYEAMKHIEFVGTNWDAMKYDESTSPQLTTIVT